MKIKIEAKNEEKIEAALDQVNGKAFKHIINDFTQVKEIAERFEKELQNRGLLKKDRIGAVCTYRPGGLDLPKSYEFGANTTQITVKRGATGWFLIGVERAKKFPQARPLNQIQLSRDQIEKVKTYAIFKAMTGIIEVTSDESCKNLETTASH